MSVTLSENFFQKYLRHDQAMAYYSGVVLKCLYLSKKIVVLIHFLSTFQKLVGTLCGSTLY
jgi:hypothetical protein